MYCPYIVVPAEGTTYPASWCRDRQGQLVDWFDALPRGVPKVEN